MDRLKAALERLDQKIDTLEDALGGLLSNRSRTASEAAHKALEQAKTRELKLQVQNKDVAVKLDKAIKRLESVLKE